MLVSDFAAYRLKRLNYPDWFYKISRRLERANNTDVLSKW